MDSSDNETTLPTTWWSTTPEGWADVSEATFDGWQPDQWAKQAIGAMTALEAMAFGYGSRAAYGSQLAWEDVVEQLKADWRESGGERACEWEHVLDAVKTGWIAGGVAPKPATPAEAAPSEAAPSEAAASDAPSEPAPAQVPGGRPDGHSAGNVHVDGLTEPFEPQVPGGRPDGHPAEVVHVDGLAEPIGHQVPGGRPDRQVA